MQQIGGKKLIFNTMDENLAESQKISIFTIFQTILKIFAERRFRFKSLNF